MRKLLASFFVLIFILLSVPAVILYTFSNTVLSREFYDENFISDFYNLSVESFVNQIDLTKFPQLTKDEFEEILKQSLTQKDLSDIMDQFFNILQNSQIKNNQAEITIPLNWIVEKSELLTKNISTYLIDNLPKCTAEQLKNFDESNIICIPEQISELDLESRMESSIDKNILSKTEGDFTFTVSVPNGSSGSLADILSKYFKMVLFALSLSLLIVLSFIALLIYKPYHQIIKWESLTFFIASLISIIIGFFMTRIPNMIITLSNVNNSNLSLNQQNKIIEVGGYLFNGFYNYLLFFMAPIFVLSALLLALSIYLKKRDNVIY